MDEQLDHFRILKREDGTLWELGRGAMGVTYKGWNTTLGSPVALKVINPQMLGKPDVRRRFLNEARAAAQLQHPNIAAVYHLGETAAGVAYYAMEFCDGATVYDTVRQKGRCDERSALNIISQVAKALTVAEQHSIVHRDLKPSNLMLINRIDGQLWVKVIDFGLACRYNAGINDTLATIGSGLSGTISFASPEQLNEEEVDIRSDFYALGACLWFMLRDESVFQGSHAWVMACTLKEQPAFEKLAGLSLHTVILLKSLLAKKPDERPKSALLLCSEIEACLAYLDGPLKHGRDAENIPVDSPPLANGSAGAIFGKFICGENLLITPFYTISKGRSTVNDEQVLIHCLSKNLGGVPAVTRDLEQHLSRLQASPHLSLNSVKSYGRSGDNWFLVSTPVGFHTFVQLLKIRGSLRSSEAVSLLAPVAAALDYSSEAEVGMMEPRLSDLWIVPEVEANAVMLKLPVSAWPAYRVVVNALGMERMLAPTSDLTLSSMQTVSHDVGITSASAFKGVAAQMASLFYQLIGGVLSPLGTFAPVSRLSEATNALLGEVQFGLRISGTEFIERVSESLEKEFESVEERVGEARRAAPSKGGEVPQRTRHFNSRYVLVVVVGLLLGWLCLYWYQNHTAEDPHAWDITVSSLQAIENDRETIDAITDEITRNLQQKRAFAEQQDLSDEIKRDFAEAIALAERRRNDARQNIARKESEMLDSWEAFPKSYENALREIVDSPRGKRNQRLSSLAEAFLRRLPELSSGKARKVMEPELLSELYPVQNDLK